MKCKIYPQAKTPLLKGKKKDLEDEEEFIVSEPKIFKLEIP